MTTIALVAYGLNVVFSRVMIVSEGYQTDEGFYFGEPCRTVSLRESRARLASDRI
jgi:hypothetical protein